MADEPATRAWSPQGAWRDPNGRLLARAFCYILEERDGRGAPRWRGICHLHPVTPRTRIPFGPGRFVLALDDGPRLELDARVTIEGDSGSIRATFRDVVPPPAPRESRVARTSGCPRPPRGRASRAVQPPIRDP